MLDPGVNGSVDDSATRGVCDDGCNKLGIYIILIIISLLLVFTLNIPNVLITIR